MSEDALRSFARERLAAFKVPVRMSRREDALPRNAAAKLEKQALRRELSRARG